MSISARAWLLAGLLLPGIGLASTSGTAAWLGDWQATARQSTLEIPFHFEIVKDAGHGLRADFFNGDDRVGSVPAVPGHGQLVLRYPGFDRVLQLQLGRDGDLTGSYAAIRPGPHSPRWTIRAQRPAAAGAGGVAPDIAGLWLMPAASRKHNEQAWRLIVRQQFGAVSAAVLGVGGDSGALTGRWRDGGWRLSNFSGTRAEVAELKPTRAANGDPALQLELDDAHGRHARYLAYRPATAHALGLPAAADPSTHTGVRDPDEVFTFSFPDLQGHRVSNTDARFRHKVVLLDVSGSWCPNCHDEAPFLERLYRKYHARGLEIVTLDFEDGDQYRDPARLRAFVAQYRTRFPVLLAGTTDQAQEKLPQAVHLDAWPTTFFIGRDGRVRHIHTGFSAAATGSFHTAVTAEFEQQIQTLLAQPAG